MKNLSEVVKWVRNAAIVYGSFFVLANCLYYPTVNKALKITGSVEKAKQYIEKIDASQGKIGYPMAKTIKNIFLVDMVAGGIAYTRYDPLHKKIIK